MDRVTVHEEESSKGSVRVRYITGISRNRRIGTAFELLIVARKSGSDCLTKDVISFPESDTMCI